MWKMKNWHASKIYILLDSWLYFLIFCTHPLFHCYGSSDLWINRLWIKTNFHFSKKLSRLKLFFLSLCKLNPRLLPDLQIYISSKDLTSFCFPCKEIPTVNPLQTAIIGLPGDWDLHKNMLRISAKQRTKISLDKTQFLQEMYGCQCFGKCWHR